LSDPIHLPDGKTERIVINCGDTSPVGSKFNSNLRVNYSTRTFSNTLSHSRTGKIIVTVNQGNTTFDSGEPEQIISGGGYFYGGSGTPEDPYLISNWTGLNATRNNLTASYALIKNLSSADADYTGIGNDWEPIGEYEWDLQTGFPFTGTFDGQNNTISNLIIDKGGSDYAVGLFGGFSDAEIANLRLIDVDIAGINMVGGLAGHSENSIISNSYSTGSVTGAWYLGGLIGSASSSTISNSHSTGNVIDPIAFFNYAGGLVGWADESTISNSYATGNVDGGDNVGGLVGWADESTISNSYATGNVDGSQCVGGSIGYLKESKINNSYSTGGVTGFLDLGGLIGCDQWSTISNCFYDADTSGQSDNNERGVPKTTNQMKDIFTFSEANWDIVLIDNYVDQIWHIAAEDYPRLGWQ
jgi:hypothetical protein